MQLREWSFSVSICRDASSKAIGIQIIQMCCSIQAQDRKFVHTSKAVLMSTELNHAADHSCLCLMRLQYNPAFLGAKPQQHQHAQARLTRALPNPRFDLSVAICLSFSSSSLACNQRVLVNKMKFWLPDAAWSSTSDTSSAVCLKLSLPSAARALTCSAPTWSLTSLTSVSCTSGSPASSGLPAGPCAVARKRPYRRARLQLLWWHGLQGSRWTCKSLAAFVPMLECMKGTLRRL